MESFGVSGHTDGLIGMAMQADGVVVRALRRSKMPGGELGSVARGEAAALAILFKPRPRLGFLGIRLLTFLSSLPSCIIFMVYGAWGFRAKSNKKLPANPSNVTTSASATTTVILSFRWGCAL
ncbi:MAG: hypothetical protein MR595_00215 [Collinsella sp.]|nr:hypothetical protein [Collinsella sp.]